MKTFKTITAAATVGLAAFATSTALANDHTWTGAAGDKLWSNPNNWVNEQEQPSVPGISDVVCWQINRDNVVTLDADTTILSMGQYSNATIDGAGHTLTMFEGTDWIDFVKSGLDLKFTGENARLICQINSGANKGYAVYGTLSVEDGAYVYVGTPIIGSSTSKRATLRAINGGKITFGAFGSPTYGLYQIVLDNGVFQVDGDMTLGKDTNQRFEFIALGVKPEGGFWQVTDGAMTLGGYTDVNRIKVTLTPQLGWADGTDVGVIAYSGTGSATHRKELAYSIDLAAFAGMAAHTTNTVCIFSNPNGTGTTAAPTSVTYKNRGDLTAAFRVSGNNLYLDISRGHVLGEDYVITTLPTKKHKGVKSCRCTGAGCDYAETRDLPQLPGDYLMTDGTGYFKTTYYPSYSNTFAEICLAAPELATAANRTLFFANDYTDGGTKGWDEWGVTYWYDNSGAFYYESDNGGMIQLFADEALDTKFHTLLVGGGKAQLDNGPTLTAGEPKPGTAGGKLYLCAVPYKSSGGDHRYTGRFNIRYLKIWEKVDDTVTMKFWLVPGMNGTQATFYDLVTESYLTPTSGAGFMIGEDPGGIMMYLR